MNAFYELGMLKLVFPSCVAAILLGGCQFIPGTPEFNVKEGEKAVAMTFPDPASTQFQNSREINTTLNDAPNVSVCGLVNTKNLVGAYTGFKRFVYNKGRTLADPQSATNPDDYSNALEACVDAMKSDQARGFGAIRASMICPMLDIEVDESDLQYTFEHIYENNCGAYLTTEGQKIMASYSHGVTLNRPATYGRY